jgi:hypothetical protein
MDNRGFLSFERCTTSFLPIQGILDNGLNAFPVTLCRWSCDLGREVIDEGHTPLNQVCVEKEKRDR